MPVATIFKNIEAGANIDEITQWYDGVTRQQVLAVVEFVTSSLDKAPDLLTPS